MWARQSYGLAYGMEAYGLAQRLGVATKEAAEILDEYFRAFPNVKSYMDSTVREARQRRPRAILQRSGGSAACCGFPGYTDRGGNQTSDGRGGARR